MEKYTDKELDEKINMFLTKKTQKFPSLRRYNFRKDYKKQETAFPVAFDKAQIFWAKYIHA
ncbi:MAG TPA: hypothetical protein VFS65_01485 [Candidatus Saccharimonadales bacterium]|nr:hypothetical protein [Candidatus Saccharimonadales bacterium]